MRGETGFSLVELLISVAILGIVMTGLHQTLGGALGSFSAGKDKLELVARARATLDRIAPFVQETDTIFKPDDVDQTEIQVADRLLDSYDNASHAYLPDGDGIPDADNDSDGRINEDGDDTAQPDPREYVSFALDTSESGNGKIMMTLPDYGTGGVDDYLAEKVLCEQVTEFRVNRLTLGGPVVEIALTLDNGKDEVSLMTRVRARLLE